MRTQHSGLFTVCTVALALILLLSGCGGAATPSATAAPATTPTQTTSAQTVAPTATQAPPTATFVPPTPTPQTPTVGGTLVIATEAEPATLDAHKSGSAGGELSYLGATLVIKDPKAGKYVPYLAQSWKMSEDGKTWDFSLKKGVKFHDGTPLTAQDYAWTFQRAMSSETKSLGAGPALGPLASAEAPDDSTLRLILKTPHYAFLRALSLAFLQPLPRSAVEKMGDLFARQPIGTGPYKMKDWVTGSKVVLERDPDYNWGPAFVHAGPAYIQTVEFRYIKEYATSIAAIESGDVDFWMDGVRQSDVNRLQPTGKVQVFEALYQGMRPHLVLNVSKPPFDDVRVRQAFSLALDRENLIKAVLAGAGIPQWGPISPSVDGYWPGVEKIGYGFDLPRAKALMKEAGYTEGAGGLLEKGGSPLKLKFPVSPYVTPTSVSEVLKEQYKALGVDLEIQTGDMGVIYPPLFRGEFEIALGTYNYSEADILWIYFHSSNVGGLNMSQLKDPELDKILDATRSTMDPDKRQQFVNDAQKRIVENAYIVPLYTEKTYYLLNNRVQGALFVGTSTLMLNDAYITQ
jgi:peptide/nickel transport system substrate-binding protein